MNNEITIENIKKIKEKIFDENISEEEKNNVIENIKKEIEKIIEDFESESDPIDE